jgi:tRNA uridine 5-carboxymethylaminomethyl modification enzyme
VFEARCARLERNRRRAESTRVRVQDDTMTAAQALSRPPVTLDALQVQGFALEVDSLRPDVDCATVVAELKYEGYLRRSDVVLRRVRAEEGRAIPRDFAYAGIPGLSREVVERLTAVRPATVGQAGRVPGVTPAAVAIIVARLSRRAPMEPVDDPRAAF